ncbi:MAG: hypothetical protein HFG30_03315 [Eubacterium sp.]|nr:hypothetical protein [Eubacterium sp.]
MQTGEYTANIKNGFKYTFKRNAKKIIQNFKMPEKDIEKKQYYSYLAIPIQKNYVFYEAFSGLGILDNPRAVFLQLLEDNSFENFTHIWSIADMDMAKDNLKEFENLPNVKFVKRESEEYYRYLASSKYLVSNSTFGYFFTKRPEQIYINTWHGVPTKYMGYDHTVERVENARGPARNFLAADYIVSANKFMTEVMYRNSYKLDGLFQGKILETGHPRSDLLINADSEKVYTKLRNVGLKTDKKIILYAPTWKGTLYNQLEYDVTEFKETIKKFSDNIDQTEYRIYLRVHYFLYKILADDPELKEILVPFTIDTNELLSVVDILISDYSSIFFDFLITKRPMIFYVPDLKEYESGRGLYVPTDTLPGLVSCSLDEVASSLDVICKNREEYLEFYEPMWQEMASWCIYNDDGLSTKRLVNIVFKDYSYLSSKTHNIVDGFGNKKKKILICVNSKQKDASFWDSFTAGLERYNYNTTDVTVLVTAFQDEKTKEYFNTLPKNVRVLVWYALPFVAKETKRFYDREAVRALGNATFDEVRVEGDITEYWAAFANNLNRSSKLQPWE